MNKLELAPGIILYKTDPELAESLRTKIESSLEHKWRPSQGVNTESATIEITQARVCFDFALGESILEGPSEELKSVYNDTHNWIQNAVTDYSSFYSVEKLEAGPYIYLKYENSNKFDWHIDDGKMYPRTVSVSAYLNEDYEGGLIEFNHFNISYSPKAGDIIVFSSAHPYMHRVTPVTSGTRYAVVNWYRYTSYPLMWS